MLDVKPFRPRGGRRERRQIRARPPGSGARKASDRLGAWLFAAGQGDEQAFAHLYDELASYIHGTVIRVIRDPAQSEEVTQEVFLEIWRLAPRYEASKGSVKSWAATIAHRRAVDRVRSAQSARNRDQRDADLTERSVPAPDEAVEQNMEHRRVQKALGQLTDLQRKAVELAYYGGYTYREVAVLLDVAEGTVKTRIRDGLIRLRDELGELE